MEERLVMYLIGVPLLGIAAQWLAWRLRLPAILLLLGCGIVLGQFVDPDQLLSEVTGGARANGPRLLFPVVSLAVAVILFEGGLSLRFHELKYSGPVVLRLVTIGAAATWLLTTIAARYAFDLSTRVALLVGAILVVTGPTVVGPLLRHIRPTRRVSSIAKWEGIVIDPIGAVLAVLVFEQLLAATHIPTFTGVSLALLRCAAVALILGYSGRTPTGGGCSTLLATRLLARSVIPGSGAWCLRSVERHAGRIRVGHCHDHGNRPCQSKKDFNPARDGIQRTRGGVAGIVPVRSVGLAVEPQTRSKHWGSAEDCS